MFLCSAPALLADYVTPGSGVHFNMDSLVVRSGGAVSGDSGNYAISQTIQVAVGDTLSIFGGDTLIFTGGGGGSLTLEINGVLLASGSEGDSILISAEAAVPGAFYGLRFRDTGPGSDFQLHYAKLFYATRAIDVFGADATIAHCRIEQTSEVAVDLGESSSLITDCRIANNRQRAITMTLSSSPTIRNCRFLENNIENNSPYNIISIGLQGVNSPIITGNHITGRYSRSGGISIWNDSNALIENNLIENCAFGILCYSVNANPLIRNNVIRDNTVNPDTQLYGFGIASNGANRPVITGNDIYGQFYGVAIINGGQPNVGNLNNADTTDDGYNRFLGNGIGATRYELFNNNALPIMAQNNWWGSAVRDSIEDRIVHQPDGAGYGLVTFEPYQTDSILVGIEPLSIALPKSLRLLPAYPNPFNPETNLRFELPGPGVVQVTIFNALGQKIREFYPGEMLAGLQSLRWDGRDARGQTVGSGVYIYRISAGEHSASGKLLLVR